MESSGLYVLSYPGIAFSYPIDKKSWKGDVDFVSLLSSNAKPATSMAIFNGSSWANVRDNLFTRPVSSPRIPIGNATVRLSNDDVEYLKIHDGDRIEVFRRQNPPFWIYLHYTTPQDLISELGPPDAIYRKSDHRLSIHRTRNHGTRNQSHEDVDDTETDETPSDDDDSDLSDLSAASIGDCFYNYFNHGFDIFVSAVRSASHPVATKMIIHGNVPGSYDFQRYRRCRWAMELPNAPATPEGQRLKLDSEQPFPEVLVKLQERFGGGQKPMPLSRGSDSPSSSCELLGGWEDGDTIADRSDLNGSGRHETTFGNTGK
jgi:hypothetical protein